MAFWQKLFGIQPKQPERIGPGASPFPHTLELIPGVLRAQIFHHELETMAGSVPCWTYVSDGLLAQSQAELVITLAIGSDDPFERVPAEPLEFFATVHDFAKRGELVVEGDYSQFGGQGVLGFAAFAYTRYRPLDGVSVPGMALQVVALRAPEQEVRESYGLSRVLARLGNAYRYYPWPPWIDRDRAVLATPAEDTFLSKLPRVAERGVWARCEGNTIVLQVLARLAETLAARMRECNGALALLTDTDATADGCFVWEPGQESASAITEEGSAGIRIAGNFIVLVGEQTENGGRLFEDGFSMLLTDIAWMQVVQAFASGERLNIPPRDDALGLRLEWRSQQYENLVDGTTVEAQGGWETYGPAHTPRDGGNDERVTLQQIVLLTAQSELDDSTEAQSLADYISAITEVLIAAFDGDPVDARAKFVIHLGLVSDGPPRFEFASEGPVYLTDFGDVRTALLELTPPVVTGGPVRINLEYLVPGAADGMSL